MTGQQRIVDREAVAELEAERMEDEHMESKESLIEEQATNSVPTYEEIEKALQTLKTGKATACNGISVEILRAGGRDVILMMQTLIELMWKLGLSPSGLFMGILTPVFKKKPGNQRSNVNHYRPVCFTDAIAKVVERIMLERIMIIDENYKILRREQNGFRKHRSTTDNTFILQEFMAYRKSNEQPTYFAFLDL